MAALLGGHVEVNFNKLCSNPSRGFSAPAGVPKLMDEARKDPGKQAEEPKKQ